MKQACYLLPAVFLLGLYICSENEITDEQEEKMVNPDEQNVR
jgi:hypothetical protein